LFKIIEVYGTFGPVLFKQRNRIAAGADYPFYTFVLAILFLFAVPSYGQTNQEAEDRPGTIEKSREAQEADKKALDKLNGKSPEEIEALDKKLAEALMFFYDREYAKALPIFREISAQVETMDIMFWFAISAFRSGDPESAMKKFKEMLAIDPDLYRVRLELAALYFGTGEYELARQELKRVLEASPPETVRMNIEKLQAAIDAKTKRLFANLRLSTGIHYDSNVSTGPDRDAVGVPGGGTIILSPRQTELSDTVFVLDFAGNALYDLKEKGGLMWNTEGYFYQTHNFDFHQFDFTNLRFTTGPWYASNNGILKIPVAYAHNVFGHDPLFDTVYIRPSYEHFFSKKFSLRGVYTYASESYDRASMQGLDNTNRIWTFNPNFYVNNRRDLVSLDITYENKNAKATRWSYNALNFGVSYYSRFKRAWEFFASYKYFDRQYKGPAPLWSSYRQDTRHNFYSVLSRDIMKRLTASVYFNWIDNNSNTDLYDFNKEIFGFALGARF